MVVDGTWRAVSIDGSAAKGRFVVATGDGRITGGYDGCNQWGFQSRDGTIASDLQGCGPDPQLDAYSAAIQRVRGAPAVRSAQGGGLVVTGGGHRLVFRRRAEGAPPPRRR